MLASASMDILATIKYVGTPLALIAFIIAVGALVYLRKIRGNQRYIKLTPTQDRPAVISWLMETYSIKDDNLDPDHKFLLMMEVLKNKGTRTRYFAFLSVIFGILITGLVAYAFSIYVPRPPVVTSTNQPSPQTGFPPPPANPSRPVNGTWDVTMSCPDGSSVNEYGAQFKEGRYARAFGSGSGTTGTTELAMGYVSNDAILVTGYVVFGQSEVYPVHATAHQTGDLLFSGTGQFGSSSNCNLTVANKN
jgi:hypothetical protein